ncbi:LysR family transcriptional regulator [Sorangium sp. So ce233]|uniref:LysR family transcriptional regulator n=1 Tax=Sorangium sp. So ce233 TaxID=3133290 RepID=UPI003F5F8D5C
MAVKSQDLGDARWDDVRLFLAVHRHGSLGQAGARLGLDASTVSRRLTALEASLGARLFDRTREGLVPTRIAELVLPAAEAMEAAHRRLARDATGAESDAEGVVRVSAAPGFADVFVAPALVRLRARHPRIRIELDASVRVLDLTRHEADLALRSVRPEGADLVVTKLTSARWVAAASRELVKDAGRVASWDALPWIAWDRDLGSFPAARWLARHAPGADIALRTSFFLSQLTAAETGLGAVLVPEPYMQVRGLAPLRYAAALEASAADWPTDDLWLVGHRALRDVPRVAAVWSFLIEELRSR